MDFTEYQIRCRATAQYPQEDQMEGLTYVVLGLCGEVGELANKFKKIIRGDYGENMRTLPYNIIAQLKDELGDVLWYTTEVATQLDSSLKDIAEANIAKLAFRKESNKIKGSGDNR